MKASLVAIAGPLQGSVFPLTDAEFWIGRAQGNAVAIEDAALSRRHCVIAPQDGRFVIRDADSRNGTLVNGVPIAERVLEPQDEIRAGRSLFTFVAESDTSAINIAEAGAGRESTVVLSHADAIAAVERRTERHLSTLLRIASVIPDHRGAAALERAILELTTGAVRASRAAVLLVDAEKNVTVAEQWTRDDSAGDITLFQHVIDGAIEDRTGVLFNPLMVVPVVAREQVTALLYFEALERGFDRGDLELAMAIAQMIAGPLESALHADRLESENQRLRAEINVQHDMIGSAPAMRQVFTFIARAAAADSTVMIRGESGTGKELVARALHRNSGRAAMPFLAINCAALTENLLESELFGYEKGAFTGAFNQKRGKFEEAEGGTLFLDEVGELAPSLQAKLLRVLQEREFYRVGGTRPIRTDVRVIAATNRDLETAARDRTFRQDLYFRLNVVGVQMPPLRERRDDIPALAEYFLEKHSRKVKRTLTGISPEAVRCLARYDWPGNVRELENAIERAIVLGSTEVILREDLPDTVAEAGGQSSAATGDFHDLVLEAKKRIVLEALDASGGSIAEAARKLGVHPNNLHRLIRTLELRPELKKRADAVE
jgi:Nif-specific regulatory protein